MSADMIDDVAALIAREHQHVEQQNLSSAPFDLGFGSGSVFAVRETADTAHEGLA